MIEPPDLHPIPVPHTFPHKRVVAHSVDKVNSNCL